MSGQLTRYSVTLGLTLPREDSHGEPGEPRLGKLALQNTLSALRRGTGSLKLSTDAFRLGFWEGHFEEVAFKCESSVDNTGLRL